MAQQRELKTERHDYSDYVVWGLLGIIAYFMWEQYKCQCEPAPVPNYVSPSSVCN